MATPVGRLSLLEPASLEEALRLRVRGMTCSHCAESVRGALAQCDGVMQVHVNLAAGTASVAGQQLEAERLVEAVARLGYTATLEA